MVIKSVEDFMEYIKQNADKFRNLEEHDFTDSLLHISSITYGICVMNKIKEKASRIDPVFNAEGYFQLEILFNEEKDLMNVELNYLDNMLNKGS